MAGNPTPIQYSANALDLSPRIKRSTSVVASPTGSSETIVASLTITEAIALQTGVLLFGWGAFTVGTNGVSVNLKIRQTDASGSTIAATGATTATAANLGSLSLHGFDTGASIPGQVYVLTATVASGSAASTFSAVQLTAIIL